jgi:UDP-N-acetylmuramate--alanine ligase
VSAGFEGRRLHLVGAGGAGMSGLALAARELGAVVTGSDVAQSSYAERLAEAGIAVAIGHAAANVPADAEVVRSTAIGDDNPELAVARRRGQRIMHRSELLAELAATRPLCIAVAGAHGKTTTTAMIAHVLDRLGRDPSYFVGGEVTIGSRTANAHIGGGEIVVIEADESDGSFLRYRPQVAVITNIEFEHPETWSGLDQLLGAFREFVAPAADVIAPQAQPRLDELELGARGTTFALAPGNGDFVAHDVLTPSDPAGGTSFALDSTTVELGVRGEHNVLNALAALAALARIGIAPAVAAPELAGFRGVARRFEHLGSSPQGAEVYDDYAHHPTELRAAIATARQSAGAGRVVVAYQPHLFSRALAYRREVGEALALADVVVVLDIYPAREDPADFPGITGWLVATDAADAADGRPVHYAPTFDDAATLLRRVLEPGDLCLALGAGTVIELSRMLLAERD